MRRILQTKRSGHWALGKGALIAVLLYAAWCGTTCAAGAAGPLLGLPPLLGRPTAYSIAVNVVALEQPIICSLTYREADRGEKAGALKSGEHRVAAYGAAEIPLTALKPDTHYEYAVHARRQDSGEATVVASGSFRTQKLHPGPFSFALLSDPHITPFHAERLRILAGASSAIAGRRPAFLIMLGDNIQTYTSHGGPMADQEQGVSLYRFLRRGLGTLPASVPVFTVNGNWEGENGWHAPEARGWAKAARKAHFPNPGPETYPEGGSPDQDYYGFAWGDALFLVLNVTGYTTTPHVINSGVGRRDDWTLGAKQKAWLHDRLAGSTARWKFLFIHHTVGGNAGDDVNSRYGRGGGRAAQTGEQALFHDWMRRFGVQVLFYGHDHVFTDIAVDGIHYVCVGSAGAPWKFGTEETGYESFWTPSGYTWVDVGEDTLRVSFVGTDDPGGEGKLLHSFTVPPARHSGKAAARPR